MSLFDHARIWGAVILLAVILAGLVARRRLLACVAWSLYLAAVFVSDALMAGWRERYYNQSFWIAKESLLSLLKLAIGVELMVRIFQHFPSAYVSVRRAVAVVVVALAVMVGYALSGGTDYRSIIGRLNPIVNDGTVWMFVALGAYCLWYHLPLDAIPKSILIGLVPYLLVYSVVQRSVAAMGWERGSWFNLTGPYAYLLMLAYWAYVAWRKAPDDDAGTRVGRLVERRG